MAEDATPKENPSKADQEREERHRLKSAENRDHLLKQLELLKTGKLKPEDLKKPTS